MVRRRSGGNAFSFLFGIFLLVLISIVAQIQSLVSFGKPVFAAIFLVLVIGISVLGFYTGFRLRGADVVKVLVSVFVLSFSLQLFAGQFLTSSQISLSQFLPVATSKYVLIPFALVANFLTYSLLFVVPMGIVPAFNKLKELAH